MAVWSQRHSFGLFTLLTLAALVSALSAQADLRESIAEIAPAAATRNTSPQVHGSIDWAQPPVACVENIVPVAPDRNCLDLTQVANPASDFPPNLSSAELEYWNSVKGPLDYCRGREVLAREAARPGSFSAGALEVFWMETIAPQNAAEKVAAIYKASREQSLPAQVLAGAVAQESMYAELGIAADGGNFSCGVGQINLQEWCRWANEQELATKAKMGWPKAQVSCAEMSTQLIEPFYAIALKRLQGRAEYQLKAEDFRGIQFKDVLDGFPEADTATQNLRYQVADSFIQNCAQPALGIFAKAHELGILYRAFVPYGLKQLDFYAPGEHFNRKCEDTGYTQAYPLNLGWLLAVGSYNAGPRAVDATAYYQRWSENELQSVSTFGDFEPQDLVESLYGAGRYNSDTDRLDFRLISGGSTSWAWLTQCILQRHIAKVVQHVTAYGETPLTHSLEGGNGCRPSVMDGAGHVITSSVPDSRQSSSGRK